MGGEPGHGPAHRQHRGDQLQDVIGAAVEEALQLVDVVIEHGHQPAGATGLEIGHLQVLEVVVGPNPELVLHGLGQVAPEQLVEVFEQGFGAPDHKREHRQHAQLARHRAHAKGRQPGVLLLHHHIHRQADQHRRRQVKQLVEHRAAHR